MRQSHYVYTAAALTAALAFDSSVLADTISDGVGGLTVAATWRAQPAVIAQGGATTFKLSLNATGGGGVSGISFADSVFKFSSGSLGSIPTSADLILNATVRSAGSTANAMVAPLQVTYLDAGVHTATVQTSDAAISWSDNGVEKTGAYSLDLGTTVAVGGETPNIRSASVPLLISVGESFGFSALADAGLTGNLTYLWDFDFNGTFAADSAQQAPSYAYDTAGVHTGVLRVLSDSGYTPFEFKVYAMNDAADAVTPLPTAVWGGLGLMMGFGVLRAIGALRGARPQMA
jgi:hypothetical protein